MTKGENWSDDGDRGAALQRLQERMNRDIPDVIADDPLVEDLLRTAYYTGEKEYWVEVEAETRRLLNVYRGAPSPPGRGERVAPHQIAVKVKEDTLRRAQAFAEVAAMLADNHPDVRRFRRDHLRSTLLTDDEARAWLNSQGGPYGTGGKLKKLLKLAAKLSRTYQWREGDGAYFVLTGHVPPVRPLEVSASIRHASKIGARPRTPIPGESPPRYIAAAPAPEDYLPNTARITITADAWVDSNEVQRAFSDVQRQIRAGDEPAGRMPVRSLEVIRFVARRTRERGKEIWEKRRRVWNESCPKGWRYSTYSGFRRIFINFLNGYVRRTYELPNYHLQEKTPFEEYRDDWEDEHTSINTPTHANNDGQ